MQDIYKELIFDHYRNPRNYGKVARHNFSKREENVFCGDVIEISGTAKRGKLTEIKFQGKGCVISLAAASLLTDYVKGRSGSAIQKINAKTMQKLLGIKLSPTRQKCAELPLVALKKAINLIR